MNENERTRILNMVKEGKISVEEAEKLLDALGHRESPQGETVAVKDSRGRKHKKLRIVVDSDEQSGDKAKVNLNIPLSLIHTVGPVIIRNIPKEAKQKLEDNHIDLEEILKEVEDMEFDNADEDIVNIDAGDGNDASKVRIYVE